MTNRLPYSTTAGSVSPEDTFQQLIEYLRLTEEDARELGKLCKIHNDDVLGNQWFHVADNFKRTQNVVSHLANSKTRTSLGFRSGKPKTN